MGSVVAPYVAFPAGNQGLSQAISICNREVKSRVQRKHKAALLLVGSFFAFLSLLQCPWLTASSDDKPVTSVAKMEPLFVLGDGSITAKAFIAVAKEWDDKGCWTGRVTWQIDFYYYVHDWFRDVLDPFDKIPGWQEIPGCTAFAINGSWINVRKGVM